MMARIGWLFISILFCTTLKAQYYPYKVAAKKDTVAIIKKVGGVNATTIGDIVKLGDTSNINELQVIDTFTMVNDTLRLSISKDGEKYKAVPILGFDKQKADTFQITSNQLRLSIERDGVPFYSVNLLPYLDNTDNQILSISGNNLTISGGNTVALPISTYTAGTGISISTGNVISNTGDLSTTNELQSYSHSGTTSYINTLSLSGGSFSLLAGTGIGISHNGSGAVTISSSGSSVNIYNSNGLLTANRTVGLNGYNLEFNGTGNTYLNCSRVGLFVNSTPYTAFSNSTTGISDGSSNNAAIDGTLWQSFGSGYAGTYYSGFSHGLHARTNGTATSYKILNCSSGSTATDRFTVYGNGTVRIQGLPNVSILGTNANGDLIASSFSGNYWGLTGNTGTSPTTNYIGTVDAQDFVVKTQATEVLRFKVGGMIGQGTSSPSFPYHMYMTGSNGFRRESSGATIRDSWKISASDFYAEYTTIGVPKATYKLYGSTNFDGGLFIENDCSRSVFGLNFIRFTSHTNNRNDIPTTAIKNTLYTDNAGNLMSSPVHCVSQNASSSSVLQTVSKVINVPTSSTVFLGIAAMENNGQVIYLKRNPASAGTGQVKISSSNGTLIDGATEYYLNTTVSGVIMVYNSLVPGWFIYGKF